MPITMLIISGAKKIIFPRMSSVNFTMRICDKIQKALLTEDLFRRFFEKIYIIAIFLSLINENILKILSGIRYKSTISIGNLIVNICIYAIDKEYIIEVEIEIKFAKL